MTLSKIISFNRYFYENLILIFNSSITTIFYRDAVIGLILANVFKRLLKNAVSEDPSLMHYFVASA